MDSDPDLHCFQNKIYPGFNMVRVNNCLHDKRNKCTFMPY